MQRGRPCRQVWVKKSTADPHLIARLSTEHGYEAEYLKRTTTGSDAASTLTVWTPTPAEAFQRPTSGPSLVATFTASAQNSFGPNGTIKTRARSISRSTTVRSTSCVAPGSRIL